MNEKHERPMLSTSMQLFFSYSEADDQLPIGSGARFGFVSMVRLNLALSLARRGIVVGAPVPPSRDARTPETEIDVEKPEGERATGGAFAALLRRHRLAAGLSQEALAERARISLNGLGALERGARRNPQRETLLLLMQALALGPEERVVFEAAAKREPKAAVPARTAADSLEDAARADILIVALTPAWVADKRCRDHLSRFVAATEPDEARHIFVIRRDPYVPSTPIEKLTIRSRSDFFRSDNAARPHEPLYRNDGTPDAAFYDVVDALADTISKIGKSDSASSRASTASCVYVAPPAADMEAAYRTLVTELESAGYAVVPDLGERATGDDAGFATIENDLRTAIASIHLLGERDEIDERERSRLRYALERAAARANARDGSFRRIIFAPKSFEDADRRTISRDPIAVRDRFAEPTRYDSIVGESKTDFVVAVKDLIRAAERAQPAAAPQTVPAGSLVFLNFHPSDSQYARAVSKAFRERGMRPRYAAFEDDKIQNKLTNAALVRESDAVVHCWATATDAWLYAEAADYEDYRKFGRTEPFRTRAAIAGPPERGSKALYTADDPPEAIDVYLDLSASPSPTASDLDPIFASVDFTRRP